MLEHQDHSGSSLRVTFVELVLEGSFDPRFATSEIFLGCIILSSSFSTAMTHLQVEVRMAQKQNKGRVRLPNRMNFWKNSKRSLTPPPHFGKLCCNFFIMDLVARRHRPDSISKYQLISIQLLKKYTLNPGIILLFINFMLKKTLYKVPKICN